jgi:GNAT superfamily N-acetyltransferase
MEGERSSMEGEVTHGLPLSQQGVAPYDHTTAFRSGRPDDGCGEITLHFRLIRWEDEQRLLYFFHSHNDQTIYLRYGMMVRVMSHARAMELVQLDNDHELALVGLMGSAPGERIVAIGRYILDEETNLAEVAFVVHEDYRGRGIATRLLHYLVEIIRAKSFAGVTAQLLSSNLPMLHVLNEVLGPADDTRSGCGEMTVIYRFEKA